MKYRPSKRLTSALAHISAPVIGAIFPSSDWAVIIPMPATFASLRQRGFNQCEELARIIGAELDVPTDGKALSHRGSKTPQASLPLDERLRNVRGVFHAKSERVIGKRCLLIDDVATSGATSAAAAFTLLTEGAASVDLITLARSTAWSEFRHAVAQRYPADPASQCAPGQP
jgi:predicted amidophosphoribosyltransferase